MKEELILALDFWRKPGSRYLPSHSVPPPFLNTDLQGHLNPNAPPLLFPIRCVKMSSFLNIGAEGESPSCEGPSDPFSSMPDAQPSKNAKIDKMRIHIPLQIATDSGVEGSDPTPSTSPIYIDICYKTSAASSNSFRFNSGWLSYSSVLGVKSVLFDGVKELLGEKKEEGGKESKVRS